MMEYQVLVAEGSQWEDSEGKVVLAWEGEWEADLDIDSLGWADVEQVEAAVATALGVAVDRVTAEPAGYIAGDASHRNLYVTATQWDIVVA